MRPIAHPGFSSSVNDLAQAATLEPDVPSDGVVILREEVIEVTRLLCGHNFQRCWRRSAQSSEAVRCTIVGKDKETPGWYGPADLKSRIGLRNKTVNAAVDVFGDGNVRYCGAGIPDVFVDGGVATDEKLEQLLNWSVMIC